MSKIDEQMIEILKEAEGKYKTGEFVKTEVKKLTPETWEKFGNIVEIPTKNPVVSLPFGGYWNRVVGYEPEGGVADIGVATFSYRDALLPLLERHHGTEITVPIDGDMIIAVAPPKDLDNPQARVDPKEVEVFYVRQNQTFIMNPGVWHWAPWSLSGSVSMLVFLPKDTVHKDVQLTTLDKAVTFDLRPPE
jgi:ureidoglycolate hydrolase